MSLLFFFIFLYLLLFFLIPVHLLSHILLLIIHIILFLYCSFFFVLSFTTIISSSSSSLTFYSHSYLHQFWGFFVWVFQGFGVFFCEGGFVYFFPYCYFLKSNSICFGRMVCCITVLQSHLWSNTSLLCPFFMDIIPMDQHGILSGWEEMAFMPPGKVQSQY